MDVCEYGFERVGVGDAWWEGLGKFFVEGFHGDGEGGGVGLNSCKPGMNERLVEPSNGVDVPYRGVGKGKEPVLEVEVSGGRDKAYGEAVGYREEEYFGE